MFNYIFCIPFRSYFFLFSLKGTQAHEVMNGTNCYNTLKSTQEMLLIM